MRGKQRPGSPRLRLFVALDLPPEFAEALDVWRQAAYAGLGRFSARRHARACTSRLVFLGYQYERDLERLKQLALTDPPGRFDLQPGELVPVPPRLWAWLHALELEEPSGVLADWQSALSARLAERRALPAREAPVLAPSDDRPNASGGEGDQPTTAGSIPPGPLPREALAASRFASGLSFTGPDPRRRVRITPRWRKSSSPQTGGSEVGDMAEKAANKNGRLREGCQGEGRGAQGRDDADRAGVRRRLADEARRRRRFSRGDTRPARSHSISHSASAAFRVGGSSRSSARSPGQDDARVRHHRRGPNAWRRLRLHRCRARDRPDLRAGDRRRRRRAARLAARLRRAGARDRGSVDRLRCGRRRRDRLGRRADAEGRAGRPDRRPDGRSRRRG